MNDFILNNYFVLIFSVEVLSAVTGLLLFQKYKDTTAKYFIYFLVYIVFMVIIGRYTSYVKDDGFLSFLDGTLLEKNYWYFTIFWNIVVSSFFGLYYSEILENAVLKKVLKVSVVLYILVSIIVILLNLNLFFTNSIPLIDVLGALIILQCVFYYFMEILQGDKILTFYKNLTFYISCAILLFWLIKTPLAFFEPYYKKIDVEYVHLRAFINFYVITFMYLTFTIGLIVSKPDYD